MHKTAEGRLRMPVFLNIGADMIVTPCPVCQMNVEVYQGQINKKYGTKFNIPVTYYSQLMTVAYGGTAKGEAARDKGPVDRCPAEQVRHGWRAPDFQAEHDSTAQKTGLDDNIIRSTKLEEIAARPAKK